VNQGRLLGGSSAINTQVFVPPSRTIIDAWGSLGNTGWSWDILEPYYRKSRAEPPLTSAEKAQFEIKWDEGKTGMVQTSFPNPVTNPVPHAWVETFKGLGSLMKPNPFGREGPTQGGWVPLSSIDPKNRTRSYSATAYYQPAAKRKNLRVLINSMVQKIVLDKSLPSNIRATGIQYKAQGSSNLLCATASKEVILAAGALQSPKILELSGIGQSALLKSLGIPVVIKNEFVGENLQDHLISGIGFEAADNITTLDPLVRGEAAAFAAAGAEYTANHTGAMTSVGLGGYAYLPLPEVKSSAGQKQIQQLVKQNDPGTGATAIEKQYYQMASDIALNASEATGIYLTISSQGFTPIVPATGPVNGSFVSIITVLSLPFSRGRVHINSTNIDAKPVLNPQYLSNPMDVEVMGRHLFNIRNIAESQPFKSTLLKPNGRLQDPKSNFKTLDDAKAYLGTSAITMWHPCGTNAMLPKDKGGVVDTNLVVYGTQNLRIIDASVFPLIPRGNLQTSVYAVAERAADLIKEKYKC
jgi:choline dehydrogenase-like flavoprotein